MSTAADPKPQPTSASSSSPSGPSTSGEPAASATANTTAEHTKDASTPTKKDPSSRPSSMTKTSPSPVTKKVKHAFWHSLLAVLLPCSSSKSTSRAHDIELDPSATTAAAPKPVKAAAEKAAESKAGAASEKDAGKDGEKSKPSTSGGAGAAASSESSAPTPATPAGGKTKPPTLTVPHIGTGTIPAPIEQDGDVAVVVPPSPHSHLLPREETEGVTSGAVQPPGSTGDATFTTDIDGEDGEGDGHAHGAAAEMDVEDEEDEEERLIMQGGTGIPIGPDGQPCPLLPPIAPAMKGRKCLVLDLDETLLHSSFKLIPQADYVVPVEIEWQWHNVYVIKRPGVDNFLKKMGELYEVVIFTASLSKYADPVLDKLDVHKVVSHRLFRESCYNHKGNYVKDLSRLGRPVEDMIILDNSPASYIFHPNNAVPVSSWFNDPHDTELTDLCPFLTDLMHVEDVRGVLDGGI